MAIFLSIIQFQKENPTLTSLFCFLQTVKLFFFLPQFDVLHSTGEKIFQGKKQKMS